VHLGNLQIEGIAIKLLQQNSRQYDQYPTQPMVSMSVQSINQQHGR